MNWNFNKNGWFLPLLAVMFFISCTDDKDYYDPDYKNENPLGEITAPTNFDWSLSTIAQVNIGVDDGFNGQYYYLLEVFDENPLINANANSLTKGVAKKGQNFSTQISVNKNVESVYIKQTDPKGRETVKALLVQDNINYIFNPALNASNTRSAITRAGFDFPSYTSIPDDAVEVTGSATNDDWFKAGKSYKITQDYSGGIYHSGVDVNNPCTLYVAANWTPPATATNWSSVFERGIIVVVMPEGKIESTSKLSFVGTAKLEVMPGGVVKTEDLYLTNNGQLSNQGTVEIANLFKFDAGTNTYNKGTLLTKDILFTNNNILFNEGYINVDGNVKMESSTRLINNCTLIIGGKLDCNSASAEITLNKGYIKANTMDFNNVNITLQDGSMLEAVESIINRNQNKYKNEGENTSLIKAPLIAHAWGGNKYTGKIGLEADAYKKYDSGNITDFTDWEKQHQMHLIYDTRDPNVSEYGLSESTIYIETTCGDVINGGNEGKDPEDPKFPIINTDGKNYTYMFEDQWPFYGDYDMNDAIIKINQIEFASNENNLVESYKFDFTPMAVGAQKRIAVAVSFDEIDAADIQSIRYSQMAPTSFLVTNGVETGQDKAVVPLIDDIHAFFGINSGFVNTESLNVTNPTSVTVTVTFSNPVPTASVNIDNLNLFIITDINITSVQSNNRKEVHIYNFAPTAKANTTFFDKNDDLSSTYGYYASRDNLAWGLVVPESFKWAKEYIPLTEAYSGFTGWITSGGASNGDWYTNPNNDKVLGF